MNRLNKTRAGPTQRHSLATMTTTSPCLIQSPETPLPLVNSFKTASNLISSQATLPQSTTVRFNSGQTKFRANFKKVKELEMPATTVPMPSEAQGNDDETFPNLNRWYLDEAELSTSQGQGQGQKQFARKLLPLNKASVQQIIAANNSNSSTSTTTNTASNSVVFFNKLNSSSKNLTRSAISGSSCLDTEPSVLAMSSSSSSLTTKILSPKVSSVGSSVKQEAKSSLAGGQATLLKQKSIQFAMNKIALTTNPKNYNNTDSGESWTNKKE